MGKVVWGPWNRRIRTAESTWRQPLAWNRAAAKSGKRTLVFCASLADVFDDEVPHQWRRALWGLIESTPDLTWLLLTKRPQNIENMMPPDLIPKVWLGVTVEDQQRADERIPILAAMPAPVRFVSCEPMLGEVNLSAWLPIEHGDACGWGPSVLETACMLDGGTAWRRGINWIICGGESGPNARPMAEEWAKDLRDQANAAQIPFLFKQMFLDNGTKTDILDGTTHREFPP